MEQSPILKSDHRGAAVSEDIRTADQAVEKIKKLGGKWLTVTADDIRVCRLHFRKGNLAERCCPSPGVVLFAQKEKEVAFVKAFSGETERVAVAVPLSDVFVDRRSGEIDTYTENMTFRTYCGTWGWRNKRIVSYDQLKRLSWRKTAFKEAQQLADANPCSDELAAEAACASEAYQTLYKEIFG